MDRDLVHADENGRLDLADIGRVALARAFVDGGIALDDLVWAIDEGILVGIDWVSDMWPPTPPTGRTFAELRAGLGERGELVPSVYAALGLAEPAPDAVMAGDEERAIRDLLQVWAMIDDRPEVVLSAARIAGEGVRRMQVAVLDLFGMIGGTPPQMLARGMTWEDASRPSLLLGPMSEHLVTWLLRRHSQNDVFGRVVESVELAMAQAGRIERPLDEPPAVAFVDISGYTELTERAGDELAADVALTLQRHAMEAVSGRRGRVVKLLGDGVMLRYQSARAAANSVLELMAALGSAGLPGAHAGVAAGPIVIRDGDIYGHTVNLASRLAGQATSGELIVTADLASTLAKQGFVVTDLGVRVLKGMAKPVELARVIGRSGAGA